MHLGGKALWLATVKRWFHEFQQGRQTFEDEPRSGRLSSAVTPENVRRVEELIREQRITTYAAIQEHLGIGVAAVEAILHEHLGVHKMVSRWIPLLLTDEQKRQRVEWCEYMLRKLDGDRSKLIFAIVTGDKTWLYNCDPESKQQSTVIKKQFQLNPLTNSLPIGFTRGPGRPKKVGNALSMT